MRLQFALTALVLVGAPLAHAQDTNVRDSADAKCAEAATNYQTQMFDGVAPFAGASYEAGIWRYVGPGNCKYISFYRLAERIPGIQSPADFRKKQAEYLGLTAPPRFIARYVDDSPAFGFKPRWADQKNCPAIVPTLERLEALSKPKLVGDGPYRNVPSSSTDAPVYRAWTRGIVYPQTNALYKLETELTSSGDGTDMSSWFDETSAALAPCWVVAAPRID